MKELAWLKLKRDGKIGVIQVLFSPKKIFTCKNPHPTQHTTPHIKLCFCIFLSKVVRVITSHLQISKNDIYIYIFIYIDYFLFINLLQVENDERYCIEKIYQITRG